jgi:hypothetical protein
LREELLLVDICNRWGGRVEEEGSVLLDPAAPAVVGVMGRDGPGASGLVKGDDELELIACTSFEGVRAVLAKRGEKRSARGPREKAFCSNGLEDLTCDVTCKGNSPEQYTK